MQWLDYIYSFSGQSRRLTFIFQHWLKQHINKCKLTDFGSYFGRGKYYPKRSCLEDRRRLFHLNHSGRHNPWLLGNTSHERICRMETQWDRWELVYGAEWSEDIDVSILIFLEFLILLLVQFTTLFRGTIHVLCLLNIASYRFLFIIVIPPSKESHTQFRNWINPLISKC